MSLAAARRWRRVGERHLQQGPVDRQRGAQLVRRVGDEAPLGFEGCLQPAEELVEGVAESFELVVGAGQREPLSEVAGGDRVGGVRHLAQRSQHAARR